MQNKSFLGFTGTRSSLNAFNLVYARVLARLNFSVDHEPLTSFRYSRVLPDSFLVYLGREIQSATLFYLQGCIFEKWANSLGRHVEYTFSSRALTGTQPRNSLAPETFGTLKLLKDGYRNGRVLAAQ